MPLRLMRTLIPVVAVAGAAGGAALYANSDWAVIADAPVNPVQVWALCLQDAGNVLGDARPGIDPGSHLYYSPVIQEVNGGDRSLVGWRFFGSYRVAGTADAAFTCRADVTGTTLTWESGHTQS